MRHPFSFDRMPAVVNAGIPYGILLFFLLTTKTGLAVDLDSVQPIAPQVAESSGEPQEAMVAIRIPRAWKISLWAAEPDVANVVAFDIDGRGRIFVCETFRQNRGVTDNRGHDEQWLLADLAAKTVQDRIDYHKRLLGEGAITYAQHDDRIRRISDTDSDGIADQSVVVADGFHHLEEGTGAGVLSVGNAVYYTCIPKLWKLVDEDQDGAADQRIVLSNGYGVRVAFRGHDMHGLICGYRTDDLYFSASVTAAITFVSQRRALSAVTDPDTRSSFSLRHWMVRDLEVFAIRIAKPTGTGISTIFGDLVDGRQQFR